MRKAFAVITLIFCGLFFASDASAQCFGTAYITSLTWETATAVHGYSSTELDYCAGTYYDPALWASFTENQGAGYALLGDGYTEGIADWIPAEIYFDYANPVNGLSYTTNGSHYLIAYYQVFVPVLGGYYWYDPLQLGFSDGFSDPFVLDDYYGGYTYVSYWESVPIYAGSTWATLTFHGQTQCPVGTPFTPTGVPCTSEPEPSPLPSVEEPPEAATVFVHVFTNPLRPKGTSGSKNSEVKTCISGVSNPGNRAVTLKLENDSSATQIDGGHKEDFHTGNRPLGTFKEPSGSTGADGCFSTTYSPPHISGKYKVVSTISSIKGSTHVEVSIPGLKRLVPGANYRLIGGGIDDCNVVPTPLFPKDCTAENLNKPHPSNHWGVPAAVDNLPKIADAYKTQFYGTGPIPPAEMVHYNDMSLEFGGKFDLTKKGKTKPDWTDESSHIQHREGNFGIDTRSKNIPSARWGALKELFQLHNFGWRDETCGSFPHWHLRFGNKAISGCEKSLTNGINQNAETNDFPPTTSSLVNNIGAAILDRFFTQEEFEVWYSQMTSAKAQGPVVFLQAVKTFEKQLFDSQEYLALMKTDDEFIEDVFASHLIREPTDEEIAYWQDHLLGIQLTYTVYIEEDDPEGGIGRTTTPTIVLSQEEIRQIFLDDFESLPDFVNMVASVTDDVVAEPSQ